MQVLLLIIARLFASSCGQHAACMPASALYVVMSGAGALSEHPTFLQSCASNCCNMPVLHVVREHT